MCRAEADSLGFVGYNESEGKQRDMIKILHSADWHMDAPLRQFSPEQRSDLRQRQLALPGLIADTAERAGCDLALLSGDIFDGAYTPESLEAVRRGLERMGIPVFIAPGNHDFYGEKSPWFREVWPDNVHIFTKQEICSVPIPQLDCRVYGGAFTQMDCPGLLEDFRAECAERYAVMVLHGDPTGADSPYCPVSAAQARDSGLDYLALGHIHAPGRFGAGAGMCAWPGCPMGRGYDETGVKGVLIVELEDRPVIRFQSLDTPRFYDLAVEAGEDPAAALESVLPGEGSGDFYRVRLTGESRSVDLPRLYRRFSRLPNLKLLDETVRATQPWQDADEDSLEGLYFRILRERLSAADGGRRRELELAAKLSRQILQGREVELP